MSLRCVVFSSQKAVKRCCAVQLFMAAGKANLEALALELGHDEYPLSGGKENERQVSYKNVDVTITLNSEEKDSMRDEKKVKFTDSCFEVDQLIYDEGRAVLKVPIVLAKQMVYHYDDYDAFRPKEELKAVASYIKGVPVTRGHPEEKIVTDRGEVLGWAVGAEFEDDELRAVLEISDKSLIEDIRSGKLTGVSPGHFSRLDKTSSGEYEGTHYDVAQRDIFIDHIAIVEMGRCSTTDGCGIISNDAVEDKGGKKKNMERNEKSKMEGILSKLSTVLELAAKLGDETLTKKLEELKKAVEEEDKKLKESKYPKPDEKEGETDEEKRTRKAETDEVVARLERERDALRTELDEIESVEREKLVDELGSVQDVKSGDELKGMSLDALKSDLELVKGLRKSKFVAGDQKVDGDAAVKSAYKRVGNVGGKV